MRSRSSAGLRGGLVCPLLGQRPPTGRVVRAQPRPRRRTMGARPVSAVLSADACHRRAVRRRRPRRSGTRYRAVGRKASGETAPGSGRPVVAAVLAVALPCSPWWAGRPLPAIAWVDDMAGRVMVTGAAGARTPARPQAAAALRPDRCRAGHDRDGGGSLPRRDPTGPQRRYGSAGRPTTTKRGARGPRHLAADVRPQPPGRPMILVTRRRRGSGARDEALDQRDAKPRPKSPSSVARYG